MTEPENKPRPWAVAFWMIFIGAIAAPFIIALWKWVLGW